MKGLIENIVLIFSLKLVASFPFPVEYLGSYQQFPPTQYSNSANLRSAAPNLFDKRITPTLANQPPFYGTRNFNAPTHATYQESVNRRSAIQKQDYETYLSRNQQPILPQQSIQEKYQRQQPPASKIQSQPNTPLVHLQNTVAEPISIQKQQSNTFENIKQPAPEFSQNPVQKQWIQTAPQRFDGVPIEPVAPTKRKNPVLNPSFPPKHEQTHDKKLQNILANNPAIKQAITTTKNKKRFMVIHPDGKVEHVDELDTITKKHPDYILVNGGTITPEGIASPQNKGVSEKQSEKSVAATAFKSLPGFPETLPGRRIASEMGFYESILPLEPLQQTIHKIAPESTQSEKSVAATAFKSLPGFPETLPGRRIASESGFYESLLPLEPLQQTIHKIASESNIPTSSPISIETVVPPDSMTSHETVASTPLITLPVTKNPPVNTQSDTLSKNAETESEKQAQIDNSASSGPQSTKIKDQSISTTASEPKDSTNDLRIASGSDGSSVTSSNNPTSCLDLSNSNTDDTLKSSKDSASDTAFSNEKSSQSSSNTKSEQLVEQDSNNYEKDSLHENIKEKPVVVKLSDPDFLELLTDNGKFSVVYFFFVPSQHDDKEQEDSKEESQYFMENNEDEQSKTENNDHIETEQSSEKETNCENSSNSESESEEHSGSVQKTSFTYINHKGENIKVTYNH